MRLSHTTCQNAKPDKKAYKMADGDGMYLLVTPNGGKYWRQDYRFAGKRKTLALGVYPALSLKDAREKRASIKSQLAKGLDPSVKKKEEKRIKELHHQSVFESVAREWHEKKSIEWTPRYAKQVLSVLERDFFPYIGRDPMMEITPLALLAVLRRIEDREALDALRDARGYVGQIFRYGIATGQAERDIAADLRDAFKKHQPKHQPFLKETELPDFLQALAHYQGHRSTQIALQLILLTMVRTTELRGARWSEIDLQNRQWCIPRERMKMRREHIVPLSHQAITLIEELKAQDSKSPFLFPNAKSKQRFITENTMLYGLYRMGYKGKTTVHGFRATASTILNEQGFRPDVIERQLAHMERNTVRASYNHAQYLPERRKMMQWWADHLDVLHSTEIKK